MSCLLFHGNVGTGKTFLATGMVLEGLQYRTQAVNWDLTTPKKAKEAGLEVVPIIDLRGVGYKTGLLPKDGGPYLIRYDDLDEVYGLEDADIWHDEAQNTTGARDWESMPKKIRRWLSEHRHYGLNLIFLTQHYKFVDVYFRRLADHVFEVWRILHLSFLSPCPDADSETGEAGRSAFLGLRSVRRPWKDLEQWWPIPAFWALWRRSAEIPDAYNTRAKKEWKDEKPKKNSPDRSAPPAAVAPREQDPLPFR